MKSRKLASSKMNPTTEPVATHASALPGRLALTLCLSLFALFFLLASSSVTYAGPSYILCANENQVCSFHGTKNIGYGIKGRWIYRNATNGINCSNEAFGSDPAVGAKKQCYMGPEGYTYCAAESGVCSFNGQRTVLYGTAGKWVSRTAVNGINCNNQAFGTDPIVNARKSCFVSR